MSLLAESASEAEDRPFLEIINNPSFHDLYLPPGLKYPNKGTPVVVELNPLIPSLALSPISRTCPGCRVTDDISCGLMDREFNQIDLVTACAGKEIIRPARGYAIFLDSRTVTEDQLNAMCSNAVYMEVCITISESQFKSLRCPKLQYLVSCRPDMPAITIVGNPKLEEVVFPQNVSFAEGVYPFKMENNPMIGAETIKPLKNLCPNCIINSGNANKMKRNYRQWFGSVRIEPQPGSTLVFDSSTIPERDMNKIFENVVNMKACLVISNSDYTYFRAPNLRYVESCAPDRPAIMVFNNPNLRNFYIPPDVTFGPSNTAPLVLHINPQLPTSTLTTLHERYSHCDVLRDIACGVFDRPVTGAELARLCAGRPAIAVIENMFLVEFHIPPNVRMSPGAIILRANPQLPLWLVQRLEQAYPGITVMTDIACGLGTRPYNEQDLIRACAGKEFIIPAPGDMIVLDATFITQHDLDLFCSEVVYMEICITIRRSNFQHLICPKLEVLKSCSPDKPAITVVESPLFSYIDIPLFVNLSTYGIPFDVRVNRGLQKDVLLRLQQRCPNCIFIVEDEFVYVPDVQQWIGNETVPPLLWWRNNPGPYPPHIVPPVYPEIVPDLRPGFPGFATPPSLIVPPPRPPQMPGPIPPSPGIPQPDGDRGVGILVPVPDPYVPGLFTNPPSLVVPPPRPPRVPGPIPPSPGIPQPDGDRGVGILVPVPDPYVPGLFTNPPSLVVPPPRPPRVPGPIPPSPGIPRPDGDRGEGILVPVPDPFMPGPSTPPRNPWVDPFGLRAPKPYVPNPVPEKPILPGPGWTPEQPVVVLDAYIIPEYIMNQVLENVVNLKACIIIQNSNYTSLRLPRLKRLESCDPNKPAIVLFNNLYLVDFYLPPGVIYPPYGTPMIVQLNPLLPLTLLVRYQEECPNCRILDDVGRAAIEIVENDWFEDLLIPSTVLFDPKEAPFHIELNPNLPTTILFSLQVLCPHCRLTNDIDEPAIKIVDNPEFVYLEIAEFCIFPPTGTPVQIENNPKLNESMLRPIQDRCRNCITGTTEELLTLEDSRAYWGKRRIEPPPGKMLILHSSRLPEHVMNKICENAVYMKVCIIITNSNYKSFRCPNLQELDPCRPDRPALKIFNNLVLVDVYIPPTCSYPSIGAPVIMEINPLLPPEILQVYLRWCPHCVVTPDIACGVDSRNMSEAEIITNCARKSVIRPALGSKLELDASELTQKQLDDLCVNAVYMEICLTIKQTQLRSLRCPVLQMLVPCEKGRPAITIVYNTQFENIYLPMETQFPPTGVTIYVELNPLIPTPVLQQLQHACPQCQLLDDIDTPAIFIENNQLLQELVIPPTVVLQPDVVPMVVINNPMLPNDTLQSLRNICPKCILTTKFELVTPDSARKWFGAARIEPPTGVSLIFDSSVLPEDDMNRICENAAYVKACFIITNSTYKTFKCPYLKRLESCSPDRPAITLYNNIFLHEFYLPPDCDYPNDGMPLVIEVNPLLEPHVLEAIAVRCPRCKVSLDIARPAIVMTENDHLEKFYMPVDVELPHQDVPLYIKLNPLLPTPYLLQLQAKCPHCHIAYDIACGMAGEWTQSNIKQLTSACVGKKIIRPESGNMIVLDSEYVTEDEINAVCANAKYMEVCIYIHESSFKSLRCPKLEVLKSCRPDLPAINIINNSQFHEIALSDNLTHPSEGAPVTIRGNPALSPRLLHPIKQKCPNCITDGANDVLVTEKDAQYFYGKQQIVPPAGKALVFDSSVLSENVMNQICAEARYIEACIIIANSYYTGLRCPHLQRIKSCSPDRPAIRLFNNRFLNEFKVPSTLIFENHGTPMIADINPLLTARDLLELQRICPQCKVTTDILCGLDYRKKHSPEEIVQACAGKAVIKPAPGKKLMFDSSVVTERQMNAMCANAIYMYACITIKKSSYRQLILPNLVYLKPCQEGRPAIDIIDNHEFSYFHLAKGCSFRTTSTPMHFEMNPLLPAIILEEIGSACSTCSTISDIGLLTLIPLESYITSYNNSGPSFQRVA
ncbi:hypothetical protein Aduo_016998 [Ancylostoma duodenale]